MKKLSPIIILTIFLTIGIFSHSYSQGNMILIDSKSSDWINTNILINPNDTIYIEASGLIAGINEGQNIPINGFMDPSGVNNYFQVHNINHNLIDNLSPMFSLIGRIGTDGVPFYVGTRSSYIFAILNESGNLFLMVNDCVDCFSDNFGSYSAVIFKGKNLVDPVVGLFESPNNGLVDFSISQNYPNPFNPSTSIQYSVPSASNVQIIIYDINGQKVREIINDFQNAGTYTTSWDAKDSFGYKISSGTYFYQVQVGDFVQTKKMILLK